MKENQYMNDNIVEKVARLLFIIDVIHTDTKDDGDSYENISKSSKLGNILWDRILNGFENPKDNWYQKRHVGDCVNMAMTCSTCVYDEYINNAKEYLENNKLDIFDK